jgi:hypothetical protein
VGGRLPRSPLPVFFATSAGTDAPADCRKEDPVIRTRLSAAVFPVLTMLAVTAYAGTVPFDFGTAELGQIKTACFFNGTGTFNSFNVSPPYFVRGIRIGQASAGDDVCDNIPGLTTPTTLPRTTGAGQQLVFDVDLVPTQLGNQDRTLRINNTDAFDLMAFVAPVSGCAPSSGATCLSDDRFKARVHWRTTFGTRGPAPVVPFGSDDSGLFYFFNADNWEVLLKVLNACPTNDRFWVFAAATTNVEYTITVTDTQEQQVKSYFKPQGPPAPAITDTNAFATCP